MPVGFLATYFPSYPLYFIASSYLLLGTLIFLSVMLLAWLAAACVDMAEMHEYERTACYVVLPHIQQTYVFMWFIVMQYHRVGSIYYCLAYWLLVLACLYYRGAQLLKIYRQQIIFFVLKLYER
jgi:hypothetical protein